MSILSDVKKLVGIEDETAFDSEIVMHINTALFTLSQLGVKPLAVYPSISGSSEIWSDVFETRKDLEAIKSYVGLRVRLLFDPPQSSSVSQSIEKQIEQLEWRINVQAETPM